jgi:hypothetical protein
MCLSGPSQNEGFPELTCATAGNHGIGETISARARHSAHRWRCTAAIRLLLGPVVFSSRWGRSVNGRDHRVQISRLYLLQPPR